MGSSISTSCSFLFLLVTVIALLACSWSFAYKLSLLALLIKDGLPGPHLNSCSWVPNNSRPLFLLVMIMKFLSIGSGCGIVSVASCMRSNCIKKAILFVWMLLLKHNIKYIYSFRVISYYINKRGHF